MRTVNAAIEDAITTPPMFRMYTKAEIQPSYLIFRTTDIADHHPSFADPVGLNSSPLPEDTTVVSSGGVDKLFTFYIHGGALKYTPSSGSSPITVSGGPATYGSLLAVHDEYIFYQDNSSKTVYRAHLNVTNLFSGNASVLTSIGAVFTSGSAGKIQAVDENSLVSWEFFVDGIVRVRVFELSGTWSMVSETEDTLGYDHSFDLYSRYDDDAFTDLTNQQKLDYTAVAKLGTKYFFYITNRATGQVEACWLDTATLAISDFYIAVPTEIDVSQCRFWCVNAYVHDGTIFLVGQFERTDVSGDPSYYTLILRSTDGLTFAIDAFCAISSMGYRFRGLVFGTDLYISAGNRSGHKSMNWVFSPTSGSAGYTLYLSPDDIIDAQLSGAESASLTLRAGDEVYMTHASIVEGARLILYEGYQTSGSGIQYVKYGTYIIDRITRGRRDGGRFLKLNLVNQSTWELSGFCSPYYSEILSKSSCFTDFEGDLEVLYPAGEGNITEREFSVDFWACEPFDDPTAVDPVTGINVLTADGVNFYGATGNHRLGIQTKPLDEVLGSTDYPAFIGYTDPATIKVYGWSNNTASPGDSGTDTIDVYALMENSDGEEYDLLLATGQFPFSGGGTLPIEGTIELPTAGDKIKRIRMVFDASASTYFCPSRVEITTGVLVHYGYKSNTKWTTMDDATGGVKVPGYERPFIMLATKPAVALNFTIVGKFDITCTAGVTDFPVACGLVGHALDTQNYSGWRYDIVGNVYQFVKGLDGYETVYQTVAPPFTVPNPIEMMYRCSGNSHYLYVKNATSHWQLCSVYAWTGGNGFIMKSSLATKVGIYGLIRSPYLRTAGYDPASIEFNSDDNPNPSSIAISVLPGFSEFSSFPSSGQLMVDDVTYAYTSKTGPTDRELIRGPYQLRAMQTYVAPYGDGWGIECRDCNLAYGSGNNTTFHDYICAFDNGSSFVIDHSLWQIYVTDGGTRHNLYNRARHYVDPSIDSPDLGGDLATRVYVTAGFLGLQTIKKNPEASYHSYGALVRYDTEADIRCLSFYGSDAQADVDIEDLILTVCKASGATATFPGDLIFDDITFTSGSHPPTKVASLYDSNFLDCEMSSNILANNEILKLRLGIESISDQEYSDLWIRRVDTGSNDPTYLLQLTSGSGQVLIDQMRCPNIVPDAYTGTVITRVVVHDNFISLYINGVWAHTFHMEEIVYPSSFDVSLGATSTGNLDFNYIKLVELSDWREAIYIDLESDGQAAIQFINQERPIEIVARSDGSITFWYDPNREVIEQTESKIHSHDWSSSVPRDSASDAIIYYEDAASIQNPEYFDQYGLRTRMLRLSNLSSGAIRAARILLRKSFEASRSHELSIRPDVRLEIGDILHVNYTATGSGGDEDFQVILEGISLSKKDGSFSMNVQGRQVIDG